MAYNRELKYNAAGYKDPTAYHALMAAEQPAFTLTTLVYICSPYRGDTTANIRIARQFCAVAYETLRGKPEEQAVANQINAYLIDAANVFVEQSHKIIGSGLPPVAFGNMPRDNGGLIVENEHLDEVMTDPIAAKYLRRYVGSRELLHGEKRWCLWLTELSDEDIAGSSVIRARLERVREFRAASSASSTREMANTPHLFGQRSHRDVAHVVMPGVVLLVMLPLPAKILMVMPLLSSRAQCLLHGKKRLAGG